MGVSCATVARPAPGKAPGTQLVPLPFKDIPGVNLKSNAPPGDLGGQIWLLGGEQEEG